LDDQDFGARNDRPGCVLDDAGDDAAAALCRASHGQADKEDTQDQEPGLFMHRGFPLKNREIAVAVVLARQPDGSLGTVMLGKMADSFETRGERADAQPLPGKSHEGPRPNRAARLLAYRN